MISHIFISCLPFLGCDENLDDETFSQEFSDFVHLHIEIMGLHSSCAMTRGHRPEMGCIETEKWQA